MSRDTQFQNFAKLLWDEIMEMTLKGYGKIDFGTDPTAYELIIVRRAYDLACHFVEQTNYGLDTHTVEDAVRDIPDMTELPKDEKQQSTEEAILVDPNTQPRMISVTTSDGKKFEGIAHYVGITE